jgi:hypothetical protein
MTPKRPRDPNQFAKSIIDIATGNIESVPESGLTKRAITGDRSFSQKQTPSILAEARDSTITNLTPHSIKMRTPCITISSVSIRRSR